MSFRQKLAEATGLSGLPSSYQLVGDVLLIKLMKIRSLKQKKKIALAIMKLMPYVKTVCEIKGVGEEFRVPRIRKLAGNGTINIHKEHGILYKLDVSKIMFSKGNLFERQRLVSKIKKEIIIDMFAGIGYFSLGLKKAKKIYAIEKNPVAFRYLKENIKLNKAKNIVPILGDNRKIARELKGTADRVIMGYFPSTDKFLPSALMMLKKKGVIHFHNSYSEKELWKKPINQIKKLKVSYRVLSKKKVKSVSPRAWHVVMDIAVKKS